MHTWVKRGKLIGSLLRLVLTNIGLEISHSKDKTEDCSIKKIVGAGLCIRKKKFPNTTQLSGRY